MTTVAILPIYDASGQKSYRAVAGDKYSIGKTAGQALDALTAQLGENEFSALLLLQSFHPDQFFGIEQQKRLSELMDMWRTARDEGLELSHQLQQELDNLVEAELKAATARTASLLQQQSQ
ncbi:MULTISPECIES: hypothetical protein [Nostocales]|uniref:Uncharacterized protein n=3 Tax=Nostocales TaxID=1161 RepID=A0A0C1QSM0_9CYAN|nr:hypothetical protein [Tolypothrix bouteillei]KAF3889759.1 hypothetical protein DA73_0400033060 [Tolypothrix bouteillei VB521301]